MAQAALKRFGRIDVWINDAGVGAVGKFTDIPLTVENRVIETNLIGVINGSHCAMKEFQKQRAGILINVASIVGEIPLGYYSVYSASKLGVVGLDRALRAEMKARGQTGIRICTVLPISTDTPFWTHAANYSGHTATSTVHATVRGRGKRHRPTGKKTTGNSAHRTHLKHCGCTASSFSCSR